MRINIFKLASSGFLALPRTTFGSSMQPIDKKDSSFTKDSLSQTLRSQTGSTLFQKKQDQCFDEFQPDTQSTHLDQTDTRKSEDNNHANHYPILRISGFILLASAYLYVTTQPKSKGIKHDLLKSCSKVSNEVGNAIQSLKFNDLNLNDLYSINDTDLNTAKKHLKAAKKHLNTAERTFKKAYGERQQPDNTWTQADRRTFIGAKNLLQAARNQFTDVSGLIDDLEARSQTEDSANVGDVPQLGAPQLFDREIETFADLNGVLNSLVPIDREQTEFYSSLKTNVKSSLTNHSNRSDEDQAHIETNAHRIAEHIQQLELLANRILDESPSTDDPSLLTETQGAIREVEEIKSAIQDRAKFAREIISLLSTEE